MFKNENDKLTNKSVKIIQIESDQKKKLESNDDESKNNNENEREIENISEVDLPIPSTTVETEQEQQDCSDVVENEINEIDLNKPPSRPSSTLSFSSAQAKII
jgi:hypothetical protein